MNNSGSRRIIYSKKVMFGLICLMLEIIFIRTFSPNIKIFLNNYFSEKVFTKDIIYTRINNVSDLDMILVIFQIIIIIGLNIIILYTLVTLVLLLLQKINKKNCNNKK